MTEPQSPALGPSIFSSPAAPAPFGFVALDIETTNGNPSGAEHWMRTRWLPGSNLTKPETIGRHFQELLEKKREKLALLDTAPVVVVTLQTDVEPLPRCLHCLQVEPPHEAHGGFVEGFEDSRSMLIALRNLLDSRCLGDTLLVGHNIKGFDLRKLRWQYVRHGLRMPSAFRGREQPVFDTMTEYSGLFSVGADNKLFVSLDDLLGEFGIPSHKGEIDGSMVPQLVAEGRFDELIRYALLDVRAEAELFLRMTGQKDDAA